MIETPEQVPRALLTVAAVARSLHLSVYAVRERARDGTLPAIRLGRLYRFRPEVIEQVQRHGYAPPTD